MKTLVFLFVAFPFAAFGQCSPAYSGTLRAEVIGNSVILMNDTVRRICGTWYDMEIIQAAGDTLIWNEIEGGGGTYCHCFYNLSVTVDSLEAGNYFVKTFASSAPFPGGDTCYIGSVSFTITEQNSFLSYNILGDYQSDCFEVNVGINDQDQYNRKFFTVYPNPANDQITIELSKLERDPHLTIFNVNGRKVIERKIVENETQIDISALQRGVYFVRLQNEKTIEVGKMVKE
jgi:hypothetical protein